MKTTAKAAQKVAATKKAVTPAKKATAAKKVAPVKKTASIKKEENPIKPVKVEKILKAEKTPKAEKMPKVEKTNKLTTPMTAASEPVVKPPKARKGADKNYVAPPTAVQVQTSAKLVHTPAASMGQVLNPPVIPATIKKNAKLTNNWKTKSPEELTDAEVIAMPDDAYMNKVQLAFFKYKLIELRDSILKSASDTTENLRHDTTVVPDPTDRATIEEEHALELRTRDRERKLLKKIQQSISRIEQDDYGYCDETGEPIGVSRLIARPTASLSLEAQQRRELKQRMFGD